MLWSTGTDMGQTTIFFALLTAVLFTHNDARWYMTDNHGTDSRRSSTMLFPQVHWASFIG